MPNIIEGTMKHFLFITIIISTIFAQNEYPDFKCGRSYMSQSGTSERLLTTGNQDKFDVSYYGINIRIDPDAQTMEGFIEIKGTVIDTDLSVYEYNLSNYMSVDSAKVGGVISAYSHVQSMVSFTPDSSPAIGESFHHTIYYNGSPSSTGFGSFRFDERNGRTLITTLSEPYGARDWWPSKDAPQDKADSVDIYVTVPSEYIVASNGTLVGITTEAPSSQRWHWHESYPITTYLVSLAIYPYYTWEDTYTSPLTGETLPLNYYVYPEDSADAHEDFNIMDASIGIFAELFAEYPFMGEKYGMAAFPWGGAMEHQTCTSYGDGLITGDHSRDYILVHELAHQWWGDLVTCFDFHHIWINEGFATYSEALWVEEYYDEEAFWNYMDSRMGFEEWWANPAVYRYDADAGDPIFHTTVYKKGAWVLHMLRHLVGDETFFEIMQTYAASPDFAYKTASTEQFRDLCESVSGLDLDAFFYQWIYESHYPEYVVSFSNQTNAVEITISQSSQAGAIFTMPLDLDIVCQDTTIKYVAQSSNASDIFSVNLPIGQSAQYIELDPENWVMKKVQYMNINPPGVLPDAFYVNGIYPNPFNSNTQIEFSLPVSEEVCISIYNINGQKVWQTAQSFAPGTHSISWNGRSSTGILQGSGTYIAQIQMGSFQDQLKILLIK